MTISLAHTYTNDKKTRVFLCTSSISALNRQIQHCDAAAIQQHRATGSHASCSFLCASINEVLYSWCTARFRTTTNSARLTQQMNAHRLTPLPVIRIIQLEQSRSSSHTKYKCLERRCSPFSICDIPGISSQPYPVGEPYPSYCMYSF